MDRNLIIFALVGIGFFYLITNFVNDLQDDNKELQSKTYSKKKRFDRYYGTDSIGRPILSLEGAQKDVQTQVWRASQLRDKTLSMFPKFEEMKAFVDDRVHGEPIKSEIKRRIQKIEDDFLMGKISSDEAKRRLHREL